MHGKCTKTEYLDRVTLLMKIENTGIIQNYISDKSFLQAKK